MPGSEPLHFKLIFEVPTGRILGAQAIGKGNADKRVDNSYLNKNGWNCRRLKRFRALLCPSFRNS